MALKAMLEAAELSEARAMTTTEGMEAVISSASFV
jgi:hypothetical protein